MPKFGECRMKQTTSVNKIDQSNHIEERRIGGKRGEEREQI